MLFYVSRFELFKCNFGSSITIASMMYTTLTYYFFYKKEKKISYMRFLPRAISTCFREKTGFDYKNNDEYGKSANFWLNTINKIN